MIQGEHTMPRKLGVGIRALLAAGAVMVFSSGCLSYRAPVKPPLGAIYTEIKAPLTVNFHNTPVGAPNKKYSQKYTRYLNIFGYVSVAWDEAAIGEIAREGGITEIAYADYQVKSILGIYGEFQINVYGN